jgi:hypothetical protein
MQVLYFSHASEEKRCLTRGQTGATKMEEIGRKSRLHSVFPADRFFGRLTQKGPYLKSERPNKSLPDTGSVSIRIT